MLAGAAGATAGFSADGAGDALDLLAGASTAAAPDPILLELFNNYFTAIATQMGITLRNTSMSVNVKETELARLTIVLYARMLALIGCGVG